MEWLAEVDEDRIYVSVASLAEIAFGIEKMADGNRRKRLDQWLFQELPVRFEGRILSVDAEIAHRWGATLAQCESIGRSMNVMDAVLAATAAIHKMTLVTRNSSHFHSVESLLNPWS
jgi:predicted nucleic acid-binding protein